VTSPSLFKESRQPRSWRGTKVLIQQAREYLAGTLLSLKKETEVIGSFDTNQQKNAVIKSFVPSKAYSDSARKEQAQQSFVETRNKFFDTMDPLSNADTSHAFMGRPEDYELFQRIDELCRTEWQHHETVDTEIARNEEQPDIEPVSPAYCEQFRYPREFSQLGRRSERRLCRNNDRCVCNTMDSQHGYIAIEFLTPRENREFQETGKYPRDVPHLCVDCERAWYTERVYLACRVSDIGVRRAINRFRVVCEDGAYSKRTMLPTMVGSGSLTGIVEMVPMFSDKYMEYVPCGGTFPDNSTKTYRVTEVNVDF
jgi:hypothetical protein